MIGRNRKWLMGNVGLLLGLIWLLISRVNSGIVKKPVIVEVKVGDSAYLNCSVSHDSAKVSWYHYPVDKGNELRYIFTDGQIFKSYSKRHRIETDALTTAINLVITQIEVGDAGRYICQNNGDSVTAELIVLESSPVCISNINPRGFIGPNSCGLVKETIQLSCGIKYKGNVSPELQWTKIKQDGSLSSFPGTCDVSTGRITCNHSVGADFEMNESYFRCQTNGSTTSQYNCITETVKIPYLVENRTRIAKNFGDSISCTTIVNSFDCSYKWIWYDGDCEETVSESKTLTIDREGLLRCEANCSIKEFKCTINTMRIKASTVAVDKDTGTVFVIVGFVLGGLFLVCLFAIIVIIVRRYKKIRKSKDIDDWNAENVINIKALKTELATLLHRDTRDAYFNYKPTEIGNQIYRLKFAAATL